MLSRRIFKLLKQLFEIANYKKQTLEKRNGEKKYYEYGKIKLSTQLVRLSIMMDGDGAKGKVLKQLLELFSLSTQRATPRERENS